MTLHYALNRIEVARYSARMRALSDFAKFIQVRRKERGLTQEQLAEAISRSPGYVGQLETDKIDRPRRATMRALAAALRVPLNDLYVASGQLDPGNDDDEDSAILLQRLAALPTHEQRVAALEDLPPDLLRAVTLLASDWMLAGSKQLREVVERLDQG